MGSFVSAMSYSATTYSAFMMIGLAGLTYAGGVGALGFELLYLCGVTLVLVFGPRFWRVGKKYGFVTPSEMIGHRYASRASGAVIALASCIFADSLRRSAAGGRGLSALRYDQRGDQLHRRHGAGWSTAGLRTGGQSPLLWRGQDSLQAVVMILSASLVVVLVIWQLGGLDTFFDRLAEDPGALTVPGEGYFTFSTFLGLTLPWIFFSISNPQVSQRLFTPGSMREMRKMLLGFLVIGFIYTLVSVFWGFTARLEFPDLAGSDMATPTLLGSDLVPTPLAIIVMVGVLAACVSTIHSIMLTLSSMVSRDVYAAARTGAGERSQLRVGKLVLPVIAVLAYWFAHLELDLIAVLSVSASAGLLVMVPPIIGAFFWSRGTFGGSDQLRGDRRLPGALAGGHLDGLARSGQRHLGAAGRSDDLQSVSAWPLRPRPQRAADFMEASRSR